MNATILLKQDHDRVRSLFERLRDETGAEDRQETLREIATELVLHSQLEEELFYPAIEQSTDPEAAPLVIAARSAHATVDDLIERLVAMNGRESEFDGVIAELERHVRGHIRDEEARLFPVATRALGSGRLDEIGRAIVARRLDAAA